MVSSQRAGDVVPADQVRPDVARSVGVACGRVLPLLPGEGPA